MYTFTEHGPIVEVDLCRNQNGCGAPDALVDFHTEVPRTCGTPSFPIRAARAGPRCSSCSLRARVASVAAVDGVGWSGESRTETYRHDASDIVKGTWRYPPKPRGSSSSYSPRRRRAYAQITSESGSAAKVDLCTVSCEQDCRWITGLSSA